MNDFLKLSEILVCIKGIHMTSQISSSLLKLHAVTCNRLYLISLVWCPPRHYSVMCRDASTTNHYGTFSMWRIQTHSFLNKPKLWSRYKVHWRPSRHLNKYWYIMYVNVVCYFEHNFFCGFLKIWLGYQLNFTASEFKKIIYIRTEWSSLQNLE